MREKHIEQKLTSKVNAMGGMAIKFTSPGLDGLPDRLILLPGGMVAFVEVKATGEKMCIGIPGEENALKEQQTGQPDAC